MTLIKRTHVFHVVIAIFVFTALHAARAAEIAQPADLFVNSIGVNTHLGSTGQAYNVTTFGLLGVRHFRDNTSPSLTSQGYTRLNSLYSSYGIGGDVVWDTTSQTPAQFQLLMENACCETAEGLNESDQQSPGRSYGGYTDSPSTQSYQATIAYQNDLYTAMKGNSLTSSKLVLSPAMGIPGVIRCLRGASYDVVAAHWYDGSAPTYSNLASTVAPCALLINAPSTTVPVSFLTETGWITPYSSSPTISDAAGGKYIPRVLAESFLKGFARTFTFEMMDTPGQYNYGIIRNDLTVKPAYTKLQTMISLLKEATWSGSSWSVPSFAPGNFDYTMGGSIANVHHLLLQKSTGAYYLLLWQEISSFNGSTGTDITNPTVTVNLNFNTPISAAAVYSLSTTTPTSTYTNPQALSISVPDEIVMVQLTPNASPASVTAPAVTLNATDNQATESSPTSTGQFTVTRTGATTSALTVYYNLDGTAVNGTDYTSLPGSVSIPSGSASTTFTVTPSGHSNINGTKTVIATVASHAGYNVGNYQTTATVNLVTGNDDIDDFESGIGGWVASTRSTISSDTTNPDAGSKDMMWTYKDDGVTTWSNSIKYNFSTAQDWSQVTKLVIRFAENSSNPGSDMGQRIFFDLINNGSSTSGGAGVATFEVSNEPKYRTIEIPLGAYTRNQVNAIQFYVDGDDFATGNHTWYIDNIYTVSAYTPPVEDFEENSLSNWSHSTHSAIALDTALPDSGLRDLKWTFSSDHTTPWSNSIVLNYAIPQDLTKKHKLLVRFKADPSNASTDPGNIIYFDMANNGSSTSGGASVTNWTISSTATSAYATVELDLGTYARDKITSMSFYVDGANYAAGNHIWYLDNLTLY